MPIKHKETPAGLADVLSEGLSTIMQSGDASAPMGLAPGSTGEDHEASTPHPVYTVDPAAIRDGELLGAAKQIGWRVLLLNNDNAIGASTVATDEDGNLSFSGLNQGPLVERTVGSIAASENSKNVDTDDFELRYLEIRPLYFAAIWMNGEQNNIIIPLEDDEAFNIQAFHEYDEDTILKTLQEKANMPSGIPEKYEDR